jgi:hypothetical protein
MLAAGAHTTLTGGSPGVSSVFFSHENPLELHHAGVGKKQGRVILWYQGGAVDYCMIYGCKKIEKSCTDIVASHNVFPMVVLQSRNIGRKKLFQVGQHCLEGRASCLVQQFIDCHFR